MVYAIKVSDVLKFIEDNKDDIAEDGGVWIDIRSNGAAQVAIGDNWVAAGNVEIHDGDVVVVV